MKESKIRTSNKLKIGSEPFAMKASPSVFPSSPCSENFSCYPNRNRSSEKTFLSDKIFHNKCQEPTTIVAMVRKIIEKSRKNKLQNTNLRKRILKFSQHPHIHI